MAPRAGRLSRAPSPFGRDTDVRVPGRGTFTSLLLALGTVLLLFLVGVGVVLTYIGATQDAENEAREGASTWSTD